MHASLSGAGAASSPPRVDGYIRVSRVGGRHGERFISPAVQRDEIEAWAASRGFELQEVFVELDESGTRADRPLLERAIRRIEDGHSSGLAVTRVDRFSRSLVDGVATIERVRRTGGGFYAIQDGLDISTDAGRMVLHILLSVAEFHVDVLRASWDEARARAIRRGVHTGHYVPVGYRKTRRGRLRPDPVTGPIITEVFRRRAAGAQRLELCHYLQARGVLTGKGNPGWSGPSLVQMLQWRVYLGEVHSGPYLKTGAHEPLTDPATFEAAQRTHGDLYRRPRTPVLLAGMVRCASCSYMMSGGISGMRDGPVQVYACTKFHSGGTCPGPAQIVATKLEPYVIESMLRLLSRRRRPRTVQLSVARVAAERAADALVRYRDNDRLALVLGEDAFIAGLAVRTERLREANLTLADARSQFAIYSLPTGQQARQALPNLGFRERRQFIRRVIDTIFVAPGRGSAQERVTICPAGTAPRVLPRQGNRKGRNRPIRPNRRWLNPTLPRELTRDTAG